MKINCPFHKDDTASLHLYADHYCCYGCGKRGSLKELDEVAPDRPQRAILRANRFNKEDLKASLERIAKLPTKLIRGLELPYDDTGYYLVYPGNKYYTKRLWQGNNGNKYKCPSGHKKPLMLEEYAPEFDICFAVEGQVNALSLTAWGIGTFDVMSPGGAGDLNKQECVNYLLQYRAVCIIVDEDAAGVIAGMALRDTLLSHGKRVVLYPMKKDLNDILVQDGKEAVQSEIDKAIQALGV